MQRKPPAAMGALLGATEGVMKAAKEATGAAEAADAAALGVEEGEGVSVPVAQAAAAVLGVVEGVSVPLGVALALAPGRVLALAPGRVLGVALTPGSASVASQDPPQRTYCAGHAVLPLCWQQVSMGSATLRGLKCMR